MIAQRSNTDILEAIRGGQPVTVDEIRFFSQNISSQFSAGELNSDLMRSTGSIIRARLMGNTYPPDVVRELVDLNQMLMSFTVPMKTRASKEMVDPKAVASKTSTDTVGFSSTAPTKEWLNFDLGQSGAQSVTVLNTTVPDVISGFLGGGSSKKNVTPEQKKYVETLIKMHNNMALSSDDVTNMQKLLPNMLAYLDTEVKKGRLSQADEDAFAKKVQSGDLKSAMDILDKDGQGLLTYNRLLSEVKYKAFTGEERVYFSAGAEFRIPLTGKEQEVAASFGLSKKDLAIGFDLFADIFFSVREKGYIEQDISSPEVKKKLLGVGGLLRLGPGMTLIYNGEEVARIKMGVAFNTLYMQEVKLLGDISLFTSVMARYPVIPLGETGAIALYGGADLATLVAKHGDLSLTSTGQLKNGELSLTARGGVRLELDNLGSVNIGVLHSEPINMSSGTRLTGLEAGATYRIAKSRVSMGLNVEYYPKQLDSPVLKFGLFWR
jgi:hypothetical protein